MGSTHGRLTLFWLLRQPLIICRIILKEVRGRREWGYDTPTHTVPHRMVNRDWNYVIKTPTHRVPKFYQGRPISCKVRRDGPLNDNFLTFQHKNLRLNFVRLAALRANGWKSLTRH